MTSTGSLAAVAGQGGGSPNMQQQATTSTMASSVTLNPQQQQIAVTGQTPPSMCLSVRDILAHKSAMFNYKLPSDRTMYESSLIYCNNCDFSCDLTDKSVIIYHYAIKHANDNIVYSYLWPQMELNPASNTYKVKYYLIKANLKIRSNDQSQTQLADPSQINLEAISFPVSILDQDEQQMDLSDSSANTHEADAQYVMDRMLDWCEKNLVVSKPVGDEVQAEQSAQDDVQELEEEHEG